MRTLDNPTWHQPPL